MLKLHTHSSNSKANLQLQTKEYQPIQGKVKSTSIKKHKKAIAQ